MAAIIKIKRSTGASAPSSLKSGELAYSYGDGTDANGGDRLYFGKGDDGDGNATEIVVIGGEYFANLLDHTQGQLTANSAIVVDSDSKVNQLKVGNYVIDEGAGIYSSSIPLVLGFSSTNINVSNRRITNLGTPTDSSDATRKDYVDAQVTNISLLDIATDSGSVHSLTLSDSDLTILGDDPIKTHIDRHRIYISLDSSGVVAGSYGSATQIPIFNVDSHGLIDSATTVSITSVASTSYDSATGIFTINTTDGSSFSTTIHDSDDRISEIRNAVSASGDLSYDASTGIFSFDVEQVYTKANFDSDFNLAIDEAALNGTGLSYDSASNTLSITDTGVVSGNYGSTTQIPVISVNAQGQIDSIGEVIVAGVTSTSYDSTSGVYTINTADGGSFATRFHDSDDRISEIRGAVSAAGDLSYDPNTGIFEFDVEQVYTKANFDSDFNLAIDEAVLNGTGLSYDSASNTLSITDTGVVAATYGSSTDIPVFTVNAQGQLDSAGTVKVAGVSSTSYDSDTGVFTINTADGNSFATRFHDSADRISEIRTAIQAVDEGGDGSFTYDNSTGVLTYTGPSATEVRAHMVAGTGVGYDSASGVISIGQPVETTSSVTFAETTVDSSTSGQLTLSSRLSDQVTRRAGTIYHDSDVLYGLSYIPTTTEGTTNTTISLGRQNVIYVHNQTGETINRGDIVVVDGTAHGSHPKVSKAQADDATNATIGLAATEIVDNAHGFVTRFGIVDSIDTGGLVAGSTVYLSSTTPGAYSSIDVSVDSGYPMHVGTVIAVDSYAGSILVDPFTEHFERLRVQDTLRVTGKIVGDSAELSQVDFLTTYDSHIGYREGALWYDTKHKTLNYWGDDSGVVHEIGIEEHQRVYNNTGSTIEKGKPLYFSGNYAPGGNTLSVPTVGLADATDVNAYNAQGLAAGEILNNSYGYMIVSGQIDGLNTSALSAGTNFFVGLGPGLVQNASPLYPNFPMCLGWVVNSDSNDGVLLVNQQNHSVNSFRVRTSAHVGADLQVDGNLTVLGSQTTVGQSNVTQGAPIYRLNEGDAIGEANTVFTGSGLDDAFFAGHFTGLSAQTYYVRIDGVGTGPGGVDTFEVALGGDSNFTSPTETKTPITGNPQLIHSADNISVEFGSTTGHDSGDRWSGTAAPINVDTGFFTNRNTGTSGVGYTHMGFFYDVSDDKWKVLDEYDSTPTGTINVTDSALGILVATRFEGDLIGDVTGNASTATALAAGRDFSLTGDITASAVSFDGTGNVQLTTAYNPGSIVNADINASAAIVDTKLATISTAGKVQNAATTATSLNTASAIVARDVSGNFAAGTITANLTGQVSDISNHSTTDLSEGDNLYYTTARHDSDTLAQVDSSYVQLRQIQYNTSNFTDSSFVTGLPISTFDNDRKYLDSTSAQVLIDATYIQSNQIQYNTSDFTDSAFVTGLPISTFDNDRKYLDSNAATTLIDASYIQSNQITYNTSNFTDSAFVTGLPISTFDNDRKYFDSNSATSFVDAAYVQARQITYNTADFPDSAYVQGLPISTFDNDRKYLDSNAATSFVDSVYIQTRQITYNTNDFPDSAFVTGLPISTFDNDRKYLDSSAVTNFVDSDYVAARSAAGGLDSAAVTLIAEEVSLLNALIFGG